MRTKIKPRSGVYPIPLYTVPQECGGCCLYCIGVDGVPCGYSFNEDTRRAISCNYRADLQFRYFINQKFVPEMAPLEIILLGGSFSAHACEYIESYLLSLYKEMGHDFCDSQLDNCCDYDFKYIPSILTIETRPDFITRDHARFLRKLGVSKIEIGVQHTLDRVLDVNCRFHDMSSVERATLIAKEEGFKVGYHIMLGLPGASFEDDINMVKNDLWKTSLNPDYVKIYPCVLLKSGHVQSKLRELFNSNLWHPISRSDLIKILDVLSVSIPRHTRVSRIFRLIPDDEVICPASIERDTILNYTNAGLKGRELTGCAPGYVYCLSDRLDIVVDVVLNDIYYQVLNGEGYVLCMCRLYSRNKNVLIMRELKVYGDPACLHESAQVQGLSLGTRVVNDIENFATIHGYKVLLVNAAYGAKGFFKRLGYKPVKTGWCIKIMKDITDGVASAAFKRN